MPRCRATLEELLAATPDPPTGAPPDEVLARATEVLAACAVALARLRAQLDGAPVDLADEALARRLHDRTRAWVDAAARARRETLDQLTSLGRARRAACPY